MGGYFSGSKKKDGEGESSEVAKRKVQWQVVRANRTVRISELPAEVQSMFVLRKTGSMYFDEDGHLAHEFYQEEKVTTRSGVVRWRMKKIFKHLCPQGEVTLPHPRLHVDLPLILLDSTAIIVPVKS